MRYNNPDLYLSHMICKSLLGTGFVTIGTFLSKSYGPFPDIFIIVFYSNYYKINLLYLGFSQTFQNFPSLSILSKTSNTSSGNFICNLDYALSLTEAYLLWSPFFVPQSYSMHNRSLRTPYKPFHYFHDLKRLSLNSMTICI